MNFNVSCDIIELYTGILAYGIKVKAIYKNPHLIGIPYIILLPYPKCNIYAYLWSQ